jgi:Resolvase, N terminal domain
VPPLLHAWTSRSQGSRAAVLCGVALSLMVGVAMAGLPATAAAQTNGKAERSAEQRVVKDREGKSTTQRTRPPAGKPRPAAPPRSGSAGSSRPLLAIVAGIAILIGFLALAVANRPTRRRPTEAAGRPPHAKRLAFGLRAPSTDGAGADGSLVLGYATVAQSAAQRGEADLREQSEALAAECTRRGLVLVELVREPKSSNGTSLERPGLGYALARISSGEATGLVVADITQLSPTMSELGNVLDWFSRSDARLVAVAQGMDTAERDGRLAAQTLIRLSALETPAAG